MGKKNLNSQASSNHKNKSKSEKEANKEIIEEAAQRLAELFYEQCLSEMELTEKKTAKIKREIDSFT